MLHTLHSIVALMVAGVGVVVTAVMTSLRSVRSKAEATFTNRRASSNGKRP